MDRWVLLLVNYKILEHRYFVQYLTSRPQFKPVHETVGIRSLHVLGFYYLVFSFLFVNIRIPIQLHVLGYQNRQTLDLFLDVGELLPLRWKVLIKGITRHIRITTILITFKCVKISLIWTKSCWCQTNLAEKEPSLQEELLE